jgi:translation elongation factor EF-G
MTQGRATYTVEFSHYEEVPHKIAQPIITQYLASKKTGRIKRNFKD